MQRSKTPGAEELKLINRLSVCFGSIESKPGVVSLSSGASQSKQTVPDFSRLLVISTFLEFDVPTQICPKSMTDGVTTIGSMLDDNVLLFDETAVLLPLGGTG